MITDPPDGRIPLINQPGGRGGRGGAAPPAALGLGLGPVNDNPETVAQSPRCLGVPMPFLPLNTAFAQGTVMQIVQSPKSMGIYMEDDHAGGGNRVIHMDKSPHPPANIKFYLGDSRGHWEGNTLVIETTNFSDEFKRAGLNRAFANINSDRFKMTERLTRTSANDLKREITFEEPTSWSRPWTILIEMGKTNDNKHMIFDSACHEGNYGMVGILSGARREEAAAAGKK